jgi:thioredoxin reductase
MTPVDALILGGGPAGCACALWLHELGLRAALVEHEARLGGWLAESPYPNRWIPGGAGETGIDLARRMDQHLSGLGLPIHRQSIVSRIDRDTKGFRVTVAPTGVTHGEVRHFSALHLVIATGVEPRGGGLTAGPEVIIGPGRRIEAFDFAGREVAILGGGDNAAENYGFIRAKRPSRLVIFARTRRARPALADAIPAQAWRIGEYSVEALTRTVSHAGRAERFDVLVVLYGWQARIPESLAGLAENLIDARGFVGTDAARRTAVANLWAIGEVAQAVHPCSLTAMSDGVVCAKAIERELAAG